MLDFRRIREAITAQEAAKLYGAEFDHAGRALCPFHADSRPSMSFHGGRFKCFACGESGDVIDYTAKLFHVRAAEAAQKLDADFHLGLGDGTQRTCKEEERRRALAEAHRAFEDWRVLFLDQLNAVCFVANRALVRGEPFSDQEYSAIYRRAQAEYLSDLLQSGPAEEQAQIYQDRNEVGKWIAQILSV